MINLEFTEEEKTVEPHLIAPATHPRRHASSTGETQFQDFYDKIIVLSVVGYLRPELPFEGLEKLTTAINGKNFGEVFSHRCLTVPLN